MRSETFFSLLLVSSSLMITTKCHNFIQWTVQAPTDLNCTLNSSSISSSSQLSSHSLSPPDFATPGAAPPRCARSVFESSQSRTYVSASKRRSDDGVSHLQLQIPRIHRLPPTHPDDELNRPFFPRTPLSYLWTSIFLE